MAETEVKLIVTSLLEERASAYLYAAMERVESGKYARLFAHLREASEKQASIWEQHLRERGCAVPKYRPGLREKLVRVLLGWFGPRRMLPVLAAMKVRGLTIYRSGTTVTEATEEALSTATAMTSEKWHRAAQGGGALRAAVFGVNDGLVSNASLIIGVAGGAHDDPAVILLAGVAGLLAGGFSMAAGEYISVATQRELFEHQIALEKAEMSAFPEEEVAELSTVYQAKGLTAEEANRLATRIVSDPVHGLDTLAREELGLDPEGLASPTAAATASFASFAVGALIPLAPYLLMYGPSALWGTLVVTEVSLLLIGALMSLFTGRNAWWSALRMALLGSAAAAITYLIGSWLGVSVG